MYCQNADIYRGNFAQLCILCYDLIEGIILVMKVTRDVVGSPRHSANWIYQVAFREFYILCSKFPGLKL